MPTQILRKSPEQLKHAIMRARSQMGVATRRKRPELLIQATNDFHAAKLECAIEESLAAAPTLPVEDRERLAALLLGGGAK